MTFAYLLAMSVSVVMSFFFYMLYDIRKNDVLFEKIMFYLWAIAGLASFFMFMLTEFFQRS